MALCAEFLGSCLFSFTGSALLSVALANPSEPNVVMAALGNGAGIAIAVYCAANISGGHITPSVTIATMVSGHIGIIKGFAYMFSQLFGSIFGSLLIAGLIPDAYIGMGNTGVGCFKPAAGITNGQLFGWEFILSFILVSTVYACAIGAPNFGNIAPMAVGVSLVLDLFAAAAYSGGGVSPARVLGPAIVFHCHWNTAWVYMLGEMAGGAVAGALACPLYGDHAKWLDPLFPWGEMHHDKNTVMHSAAARNGKQHQQGTPQNDSAHDGKIMDTSNSAMPLTTEV